MSLHNILLRKKAKEKKNLPHEDPGYAERAKQLKELKQYADHHHKRPKKKKKIQGRETYRMSQQKAETEKQ